MKSRGATYCLYVMARRVFARAVVSSLGVASLSALKLAFHLTRAGDRACNFQGDRVAARSPLFIFLAWRRGFPLFLSRFGLGQGVKPWECFSLQTFGHKCLAPWSLAGECHGA